VNWGRVTVLNTVFLCTSHFQHVADVIPKITALPRSCVVIPCSFKMEEEYVTRLRVLWVTKKGGYMFHTDPVDVLDNFKGRTRLLGNLDEQDCTVEMDNVQTHDNGPCVFIIIVPTARETISHSHMGGGVWETVSAVTFVPTGYEEKDEIVCTAKFWGGKTQENTAFLSIRSKYRLIELHPICFGGFLQECMLMSSASIY
uniref:Immunoglobulin V-set domain-containing protein n=1 Tax=Sinocyclocheilus rhinocerous TaxID=307959 RepID=A0A673H936_9TELE